MGGASRGLAPLCHVHSHHRSLPKQGSTIRVDYGVGKSASGLYIAFNEAF